MPSKDEHLKDTVAVLIGALNDKETSVTNAVIKSLSKIANAYPNEVVNIFCDFYKTSTVTATHLANVIKVLEQTCVHQVKRLRGDSVAELVGAMLRAMTQNTNYEPVVQMGASAVLVAVGHLHLDLVLRALINELTPSAVPHYTIPHTLGTLSAVNTHATVPHVKEILSKMLPLLPLVKIEGTKQAFAYAFGHFAVAVSEQIGDNVQTDNITSIKENFVVEFSVIFDVLFSQWLHSQEVKVTESVLEALGPITRLISERKFDEIVNKFVLALLSLYRRTTLNAYYVSQCISYLLTQSPLNPKLTLNDNVLSSINHTLFNLVLLEPDYDQPQTVRNHFEVLRCFDHMASQFPDHTIESLLHQCKNNQEKDRIKAVIVLTHLTTSSQTFVDKYAAKFVAILKVMVAMEQGIKMKKVLVKAIVGLVYRNCITSVDDFLMLEFIVKHCGYEAPPNSSRMEAYDLQDTCKSSLILMCNTVTSVKPQIRNLLLYSLTSDDFLGSITTVTHCLVNLFQNNTEITTEEQTEKMIKFTPELVFVRCLIFLIDPEQSNRNKNILLFLEEYSGEVHKNLKNSWNVEIQRLLKYVDKNESLEQWHDILRDLLVSAVEQVNSNKWVEAISAVMSQQVLNTKQPAMVKGISLQYLAVLSCHMSNVAIVENVLKVILLAIRSVPINGCLYVSKAVGIASQQHGEYMLNELDLIYKEIESKRSNKFLNFISSKHSKTEVEINIVKYAVITCYGQVAHESLDVNVLARLGENVTAIVYDILKSNPNIDLCRASITSLYEIGKALQPAAHHSVALRNRWQLLNGVLEQLLSTNLDKRNVELYPIIVKASKALTKLQKGILPEERNTILRVLFNSIFGELASFKRKYENEDNETQNDILAKTLNDSLALLHELIKELVIQSTCLSTIDDLVSLLLEWLRHENDEIRTSSIMILYIVFDTYIKNVKLNYETPSKFGQMGFLLGLLVPGIADTNFSVRQSTIDCIKLILQIQDLYEGHTVEPDDDCMKSLSTMNNNILTNDLNMISEYSGELSDTISDKIPHHQIMQFVESILECFEEHELRSTGISAVLDALFTKKGLDLYQNIERIVEVILETMERIVNEARYKLLKPLCSLASHHSNAVTAVLLSQPIPLKPCVVDCWHSLASDKMLSTPIVENFVRLMTSIELFEDPYHISENHIAALQPLTLISAFGDMLEEDSMQDICKSKFPELFSVLYTTLACYADAVPPAYSVPHSKSQERIGFIPNREAVKLSPAKITLHTFDMFLLQANCQKVKEACSLYMSIEHGDPTTTFLELVPVLGGALCRESPQHLARIVSALAPYARSSLPPHRCAVLAFFGELLNYRCNDNAILTDSVMATLNSGWKDTSDFVRVASLRGVANIAQLKPEQCAQYLPNVFFALSQGIDAQRSSLPMSNVPLASIQGLCRLLVELKEVDSEYHRELLSISQKIRPFMNTDCSLLREHSIGLFGILASKIKSETLVDQAVMSLPCFLLHLSDNKPAVVRASKFTLKSVFKTFNVTKSNNMVQNHLLDEGKLYLEEFLADLLRLVAEEMPHSVVCCIQNSINYLHSAQDDIRPYPPLLIGILYAELIRIRKTSEDPSIREIDADVTKDARTRLTHLVKDANPLVRQHAAVALANICVLNAHHS